MLEIMTIQTQITGIVEIIGNHQTDLDATLTPNFHKANGAE